MIGDRVYFTLEDMERNKGIIKEKLNDMGLFCVQAEEDGTEYQILYLDCHKCMRLRGE